MCIDIVGASRDMALHNNNIKLLTNFVSGFIKKNNLEPKKITSFTGDGIFIVFADNMTNSNTLVKKDNINPHNEDIAILPLMLAIESHIEFRKETNHDLKIKIGIAYGSANMVEEAEILNGLPYWGEAPTIAKRLCDLCDPFHILLNDKAEQRYKECLENNQGVFNAILFDGREFGDVFHDIGRYYVKHKQPLEVFNFYLSDEKINRTIGNLSLPLDKRGIIDRLALDEKLSRPLDFFFESEAYELVRKIDREDGMILLIDSAKRLYESLFEDSVEYFGINKLIPSEFYNYNQQFLTKHAEILRKHKDTKGVRIMLMSKEEIRKDWYRNSTRTANTNFIRFHIDHEIRLIQVDPIIIRQSVLPSLVSKYENFYLKSSHIGIWKDRYAVLFGKMELYHDIEYDYKNNITDYEEQRTRIGKFWIFSNDKPQYKYCEDFFHEILKLDHGINELTLDEKNMPLFKAVENISMS